MKPDVAQRPENDREISSTGGTEQAGDVLNDDPSSWAYKLICDPGELKEETAAGAVESCSSAGDADVLAWEPACENVNPVCDFARPSVSGGLAPSTVS